LTSGVGRSNPETRRVGLGLLTLSAILVEADGAVGGPRFRVLGRVVVEVAVGESKG
jgi:hypothetical protein